MKGSVHLRHLKSLLGVCDKCGVARQIHTSAVLRCLCRSYHRLASTGTICTQQSSQRMLWRQQNTCFSTATVKNSKHRHGTAFRPNLNQFMQPKNGHAFSAENRYLHKHLYQDENYRKYFVSAIDEKELKDFHERMIAGNKKYSNFDYYFTSLCTRAIIDPYDTQLVKTIGIFSKMISDMKTEEILCVVRKYHEKTVQHSTSECIDLTFRLLLSSVTQELSKRIAGMTPEEMFKVADLLYFTNFHRDNVMIKAILQQCISNPDILDILEQRILFFFYLGLERLSRRGITVEMQDQDKMAAVLENCNMNEIGVVALGLFRAEIQLKSEKLGLLIVKKLEDSLQSCHPIPLSATLKFLQHTADKRLSEKFPVLNEALTNRVFVSKVTDSVQRATSKDTSWVMRICRLYSSVRFCPEEVFQAVVHKVLEHGTGPMRLKDIAELLMRFSNFAYSGEDTQQFYQVLKDELLRRQSSEFENYIVCLSMSISAFIQMGVYPLPLIEMLFSEESLTKFGDKKFYLSRLPYVISESVKVERPDYGGPLLPARYTDKVFQQPWYVQETEHGHIKSPVRDSTLRVQLATALEEALEKYLGDTGYFKTRMFLPHFFSYDIGLAVDETGDFLPVKDWCYKDGSLKPLSSYTRIVIVPLLERDALYTYMDRDGDRSQRMVSKIIMKFRQLKLLGFNVVHVFQNEFNECHNKQDFLHDKLSTFIRRKHECPSSGDVVGRL